MPNEWGRLKDRKCGHEEDLLHIEISCVWQPQEHTSNQFGTLRSTHKKILSCKDFSSLCFKDFIHPHVDKYSSIRVKETNNKYVNGVLSVWFRPDLLHPSQMMELC